MHDEQKKHRSLNQQLIQLHNYMDIQELRQFIETSDFTPETKQKISIILAGKAVLDYDTYAGVKEVLQQELDNDFDEAGVGDLSWRTKMNKTSLMKRATIVTPSVPTHTS